MRAGAYIDSLVFNRITSEQDISESVRMAVCACADVLYSCDGAKKETSTNSNILSETTDGYRVDYADPNVAYDLMYKKLYAAADMYLPINHPLRYRGGCYEDKHSNYSL